MPWSVGADAWNTYGRHVEHRKNVGPASRSTKIVGSTFVGIVTSLNLLVSRHTLEFRAYK